MGRGEAFVRRTIRFALEEEDVANLRIGIAGCGGIAGAHIKAAYRSVETSCAESPEITTQE